jgi:transposase
VANAQAVLRRLGGTAKTWRTDRMATVINPATGRLQASFAPVAKHYGVKVVPCPPRRGNRKGVVEKNIDFLTQRWWRTTTAGNLADAQTDLDRFCQGIGDVRRRGDLTVRPRPSTPGWWQRMPSSRWTGTAIRCHPTTSDTK